MTAWGKAVWALDWVRMSGLLALATAWGRDVLVLASGAVLAHQACRWALARAHALGLRTEQ